jgi:hypothetical protein
MPKTTHAKILMGALQKFDPKDAEKVLDILAEAEEKGHHTTSEEENLRSRLEKCLEAYNRTASMLERG